MISIKQALGVDFRILLWATLFFCLLAHPSSDAAGSPPGSQRDYVLVINSYAESTPWSAHHIGSVVSHIEGLENMEIYVEHMNMSLIDEPSKLEEFRANLVQEYGQNPPRALILLGNSAALVRDFARASRSDIPTILCAEEDYLGPEEAYLVKRVVAASERTPLSELARTENLTVLHAPVALRSNIDLMRRMIPRMERLVLVGDSRYSNQQIDAELTELIRTEYPGMDYRFFSASNMSTDALLDSLSTIDSRHTGILFSSWIHKKQVSGYTTLVSNPFRIIASSMAPLFSLHPTGISQSGMVGGYVYDEANYEQRLIASLDAVLSGTPARDIPFYVPQDARPMFNYPALIRHGISPELCPINSVIIDEPRSFFEQHKWTLILLAAMVALLLGLQQWRISVMQKIAEARRQESESRAKYSNLFNRMPILYMQEKVLYDAQGRPVDTVYCDVNAFFERLYYTKEEAVGKRGSELFPESTPEFLRFTAIALEEGRMLTFPYYDPRRDRFFEIMLGPSYLADHIDVFCLDTTELHLAQQKLDSINHKLSMALEVASIIPWKWDLQSRTILCDVTRAAESGSEQPEEAQLSVPESRYFAKIHKEDRDRVESAYRSLIEGRTRKVREEYRLVALEEGRWKEEWIEAQAAVETRDETGRPLSLVGSLLVITDRKRMEQELRSARDRAEESNRLKSAFLANMSHEIRTPLNAIVGFSGILASTDEPGEREEYVSIIENNNSLLLQLISDILDLSKIEAGTLEFVETDFELNTLMREKENIIRMKIAPEVELSLHPGAESCPVRTDKNRLSQVLINLLTNAAKFTQRGSIRFGYEIRGNELRFYVSDTGCGIPADRVDQVFDRFVKLNSFKQGTGLGLSICRTIVEHLGGKIGVESEEGKGSTFWFTLPYKPGTIARPTAKEFVPISVEKDQLTILIAEDNESNYRLLESILRHEYRLLHAWDGREAVALFRAHRPHVVLMDINMPVMDGYEATREIRKIDSDIPIVAITAFAYASDEQRTLENGFSAYMPKPINANVLKAKILEILRTHMTLI